MIGHDSTTAQVTQTWPTSRNVTIVEKVLHLSVHSASIPPGNQPESISSTMLERVRNMSPEAWGRLVELYGPVVYRWCRNSGLGEHDAADVVQDVFTSVAKGVGTFRRDKPSDSFKAWLATITRNRVRDMYRRKQRRPGAIGGSEINNLLANVPSPSDAESSQELEAAVSHRMLDLVRAEFEQRTWDAFWRTTVDEQKPSDVARDLGISVFAVYQSKSRVLRRLRTRIGELPT